MPHRDASGRIDQACGLVVAGKLALRQIASWVEPFGVRENEFRLLWLLFQQEQGQQQAPQRGQVVLTERLAVSAAQVSGLVERLRERGFVAPVSNPSDRRRQFWRLTPAGKALVSRVISNVAALEIPPLAEVAA
jgi:DNA-binding MarR family transcriptional regulator